jgi:hypothetical protein
MTWDLPSELQYHRLSLLMESFELRKQELTKLKRSQTSCSTQEPMMTKAAKVIRNSNWTYTKIIWQLIERLRHPWVINAHNASVEEELEGEFNKVERQNISMKQKPMMAKYWCS